ncbi:DUF4411 family protein [Anaerolinea sp.]|uniref:DUF4411 family protein n=1 Tax=Anaerolinea sp. TaxID=1872519 RepID=UPI002629AE04|nr:DUF4411 family protein [uncultured Anaerolinea sp.]
MKYCLDANVFIEPSKGWYAFDIAPAFWDALLEWRQKQILCSILPIYDEIVEHKEQNALVRWVKEHGKDFFLPLDEDAWIEFGNIADLVRERYEDHIAEDFLDCSDPMVIAYARAHGLIVVTEEKWKNEDQKSNGKVGGKKIHIPNVCQLVEVQWVSTVEMLRDLKFQFK